MTVVRTCTSSFTVDSDVVAPVCPVNWDIVVTPNDNICKVEAYQSMASLTAMSGQTVVDDCTQSDGMSFTYSDEIVPVSNCDGGYYFSERQVIRTYTFTDQCGNQSALCPQLITYNFDDCRVLTDFGRVGVDGSTSLVVSPDCDIPTITVVSDEQGVCGYVEYMWLVSTEEDANGQPFIPTNFNIGTTWKLIEGANDPTYDPGVISEDTYYVRCARNFSCCDFRESNIVSLRVEAGATCPVITSDTIVNSDCNKVVVLSSPDDDFVTGDDMKYITDQEIKASNRTMLGSTLVLDGRQGVEMNGGFEIGANSKLEVYTTGCPD